MTNRTAAATSPANGTGEPPADAGATAEFERLYRANVYVVTAYFARRTADPQLVADLTADTFVADAADADPRPPAKGSSAQPSPAQASHNHETHQG